MAEPADVRPIKAEPEAASPAISPAESLRALLEERRGERHGVALQDYPDPDAISSAMAYREIASRFDIETDILYAGLVSHPENLALVNLLEIEMIAYTEAVPLERYDAAIFIDNQGTTTRLTSRLKQAEVPTLAVIDHHDPQEPLDALFTDIRPVGAAATIMAEYLASGVFLELDPTSQQHVNLTTALMHGLHSETNGFVRAGKPEMQAAAYLADFLDPELLERVLCVQKSRGTMDVIQTALARRVIRGGLSISGVSYVRWADRDAIPQAADFLLTEENVRTAIVYGIITDEAGQEKVSGSLRTNDPTMQVDSYLKKSLGKDPSGRPYGGGRSRAGGFEMDLGFLSGTAEAGDRESKWALFDGQIRRKLLHASGLDDADAGPVGMRPARRKTD